jgi:hypothetical protein
MGPTGSAAACILSIRFILSPKKPFTPTPAIILAPEKRTHRQQSR